MEDFNRKAQAAIFKENNAHRGDYTIDLHGLYVKVSQSYVIPPEFLLEIIKNNIGVLF